MKLATQDATAIKIGSTDATRAYLGSTLVWEAGDEPTPSDDYWLWQALPSGPATAIARAGLKFIPSTALLVKGFRLASNSTVISTRIAHLYAADTQLLLTTGGASSDDTGWVELPASDEVVLYAGRPYALVGGHEGGSPTRLATVAVGALSLAPSVAFVEPVTSTTANHLTYPSGGAADATATGVDALVEEYTPPTGPGWAARLEQIGERNDSAQGGWAFTPAQDITVTRVRVRNIGVSADYTVRIWRVSDQTIVASTAFSATGMTEHTLNTPADLDQGVQYVLTAARNTSTIIRLYSDRTTGMVVRSLLSFDGGRSAASHGGFPSTIVGVYQGVDMMIEPR